MWLPWQGGECPETAQRINELKAATPQNMQLLACLGPAHCQREYRAISCRQFPFFPYITEDFRFIGLAYEWAFEETCWVINHLDTVRDVYREVFLVRKRRIPILHRNGRDYLLSPGSDRIQIVGSTDFRKYGFYKE